jgi:hypothetical protein
LRGKRVGQRLAEYYDMQNGNLRAVHTEVDPWSENIAAKLPWLWGLFPAMSG